MLNDERLHTCTFRYRNSGPQKGKVWAQPTLLREHTVAKKKAAAAARLPKPEAEILKCQVIIEVLGLDAHNHGDLIEPLMEHINAVTNYNFTEHVDPLLEIGIGEWTPELRGCRWTGKITAVCWKTEDRHKVFRVTHGRQVCIDGIIKSISVTAPILTSLEADIFNAPIVPIANPSS
jgi:hypothetical protein